MNFSKFCMAVMCLAFGSCLFAAPVAQIHQSKGPRCEGCHTQIPFADYNKCLACHGGREKLSQTNPQHSAMKNVEVPCSVCHKGHQER